MENETAASGGMNLRLLINQKSGKMLFAEAGKDFVDLLFTFLTLPTGSVMKLLSPPKFAKRVGCLTNVYNSVNKLDSMFMNADKSRLLEPNVMSADSNELLRVQSSRTNYYLCGAQLIQGGGTHHMATQAGGRCACGRAMIFPVKLQNACNEVNSNSGGSSGGGYVKETVTFIITDELEISPASTITSINLLNKLKVGGEKCKCWSSRGAEAALGLSGFHHSFGRRFRRCGLHIYLKAMAELRNNHLNVRFPQAS